MAHNDESGTRSEFVRRTNLSVLLGHLHRGGPATRSDLVAASGLTRSAVGALVGALAGELGFVTEERSLPDGQPGRPSPLVSVREHHVVLSMEVLVDSIAVAAVSLGGTVIGSVREEQPREAHPPGLVVERLTRLLVQVVGRLGRGARIHGVGVAVAGLVRRHSNTVAVAPNLGWVDVPLADMLRAATSLDVPIFVGNEGDFGGLAESRRGVAAGLREVVYISGEVGIGGGLLVGGQPLVGADGFAGEIGHIPVRIDGERCNCGATGCWETEVGEQALLRRVSQTAGSRAADVHALGGRAAVRQLLDAAAHGDAVTLEALREHGRWLGFGLAGIVNTFDPELVVLGGYLADFFPYLESGLNEELGRRVFDVVRERVSVVPAALGVDAPLLGAAEWAWDQALADPAASARTAARRPTWD